MAPAKRFHELMADDFIGDPTGEASTPVAGAVTSRALRVVKANLDGIETGDVADTLEVDEDRVVVALRELEREREVYSRELKHGLVLWYPNGRIPHPYLEFARERGSKTYRFTVQEAKTGPVAQIQERGFSLIDGERIDGAILVDTKVLPEVIEDLTELLKRFDNYQSTKVTK